MLSEKKKRKTSKKAFDEASFDKKLVLSPRSKREMNYMKSPIDPHDESEMDDLGTERAPLIESS